MLIETGLSLGKLFISRSGSSLEDLESGVFLPKVVPGIEAMGAYRPLNATPVLRVPSFSYVEILDIELTIPENAGRV